MRVFGASGQIPHHGVCRCQGYCDIDRLFRPPPKTVKKEIETVEARKRLKHRGTEDTEACHSVISVTLCFQSDFPIRVSMQDELHLDGLRSGENSKFNLVSTMLSSFLGLGQASWFGEAKNVFDLADESRQMGVLPQRVQQLAR